jgi:hypothetical protein
VGRKTARDVGRTWVPSDVLAEHISLKAKGMEPFWNSVGRVVADEHRVTGTLWINHLDGAWLLEPE